jgi:hypothetical protein
MDKDKDKKEEAAAAEGEEEPERKLLLVQQRYIDQEDTLKSWREWSNKTVNAITGAFDAKFGHFLSPAVVHSSADRELEACLPCVIAAYAQTGVLVGLHGAGLTNLIFMSPGSLLVEISGKYDTRIFPVCGYSGGLAAVFGIQHFIHYYDWKGGRAVDAKRIAAEALEFHTLLAYETRDKNDYLLHELDRKQYSWLHGPN